MEAAEKAKELAGKFLRYARKESVIGDVQWVNAKHCALICLDEMIETIRMVRKPEYTTFIIRYAKFKDGTTEIIDDGESCDGYELIEFFESVKQSIQSL